MNEGRFTGRTAVVTGAVGGIGRVIANRLAVEGARVWATDIRDPPEEYRKSDIEWAIMDVTKPADVDRTFVQIEAKSGPVSLLVNAAGGPGNFRTTVDLITNETWRHVVAVNLDSVFHCSRAAARSMKALRQGAIVNVSSGAGRTYSRTGVQPYAAAKAGVIGLTRQLARELGPFGIRVNCVAPGLILVEATRDEWSAMSVAEQHRYLSGVALGRIGKAADVAGPIVFFLSDDAEYITGQTISVDGGRTMLG